jgi:hypothetical protein
VWCWRGSVSGVATLKREQELSKIIIAQKQKRSGLLATPGIAFVVFSLVGQVSVVYRITVVWAKPRPILSTQPTER